MHWPLFLIFTALFALFAVARADDKPPAVAAVVKRLAAGEPTKIVCFGDSITGAYYHTGGERAWCDMLGLAIQRVYPQSRPEMINAGISGHTTVNGLATADRLAE